MSHICTRFILFSIVCFLLCISLSLKATVVVDSHSKVPLPNASLFNKYGKFVGVSGVDGKLPYLSVAEYPVTVRYIGFYEKTVERSDVDSVYMEENIMELPEIVVETRNQLNLHILAYVREYSSLSTYTDTVFMFREKMVDFMLPNDDKSKFKGWRSPRVLASKSYYRFNNSHGLDSVSDKFNQHFSWSDWVGIPHETFLPAALRDFEQASDTVRGKYSPTEIWVKNKERIYLDVDVLADTLSRKWVPNLSYFFNDNIDFEQFKIRYNYNNVGSDKLEPIDMSGFSFNIETNGRGRGIFMFNRVDEPSFVSTYAEVYILDKEYLTTKEAKKWIKFKKNDFDIIIMEPESAPPLQPSIQLLVDRVNSLDNDQVRLALTPDQRLVGRKVNRVNVGHQIAKRVLGMFGLDQVIGNKKREKKWKEFRDERKNKVKGEK